MHSSAKRSLEARQRNIVSLSSENRDTFGVDSLKLVERPDLSPGPGQVVLKMKVFSINYRDLLVVNGVGRWKPPLPHLPLSDGVGIVTATGNGVSRVQVGDRVAPIFYPKWLEGRVASEKIGQAFGGAAADGVLAEYTLVDQASLVPAASPQKYAPSPPSVISAPPMQKTSSSGCANRSNRRMLRFAVTSPHLSSM